MQARRYRKIATVLARQLAEGEVEQFDTLEGPVTVSGPDWRLTANNARREQWPAENEYFSGPYGYEPTGEVVDGQAVYRKKPGADVLAYEVDTDDHPPLHGAMPHLGQAYRPARGYWVATLLDGSHQKAIDPQVFRETYQLVGD